MRKNIFILFVLFSVSLYSQTFNGVKIDGNINDIVPKLEKQGYTHIPLDFSPQVRYFTGSFIKDSCDLIVFSTPEKNIVETIEVKLYTEYSWTNIKTKYEETVKYLSSIYGKSTILYEIDIPEHYIDGLVFDILERKTLSFINVWEKDNFAVICQIDLDYNIIIQYVNIKNRYLADIEWDLIEASL
ncbi:MAG: hypothetical protein RSE41_00305 [Clostridia bacterium]